jgi:SAM-dependent methyltransferase
VDNVHAEDRWLRLGAREKAESIVLLTDGIRVDKVMEVGAGTGAVLEELSRRGVGSRYWACEPTRTLYDLLKAKDIVGLQSVYCSVVTEAPLQGPFDLAILSHVLEHVLDPAALLAEVLKRADLVVLEVPLEATLLGTLRAKLRALATGRPREANLAGHVNFWSAKEVATMVEVAGGTVVGRRRYFPRDTYAFLASQSRAWVRVARRGILRLPDTLVSSFYYAHLALLIRRRETPDAWKQDFYHPPSHVYT